MPTAQRVKGGPLAKLAGRWSNERAFLGWLNAIGQPANTPRDAAEFIRARCRIESRAQLDHEAEARALFERYVRGPYAKYRRATEDE